MCGVPHHAAEGYIAKLIRKGFKVAICEQVEDPRVAKKLVRREVTRVVTPGTAADSSLNSEENNFLAAVAAVRRARWLRRARSFHRRISRHRIPGRRRGQKDPGGNPATAAQGSSVRLHQRRCSRARGVAARGSSSPASRFRRAGGYAETPLDDWIFAPDHAIPLLENHFGVLSLEGFGLAGKPAAAAAAGAILYYVRSTQRGTLEPCRPHRILRAAKLPGARCGHGAQSGTDRASVCRRRCGHHFVSLDRRDGHAHGQTAAAFLDAAASST